MKKRSQRALIVACLAGLNLFATPVKTPLSVTGGKPAGVYFTENKGQVHDQNSVLRPDVLYSGSTGQMVFHLRQTGVSYQLSQVETSTEVPGKGALLKDMQRQTICRVDMNWVNANPKANITTEYTRPGVEHYYQSAPYAGVTDVRSFGQVTYENLYPGISLKWYEKDGHLKYDYLVAAGADYSQVQLLVEGAENLRINAQGEVEIKTAIGTITEHAPQVTQNEKVLPSRWVLKGKVLSFAVEGVDPGQPLIIDPAVYAWITYYGGTNGEDTHSCKTDNLGNVYFAGETRSTTAIATSGAYQTGLNGGTDAFLAKFTAGGVRLWATYYGISGGSENAHGCDVDGSNNVYMAGRNQSGAVLFKFNSNGLYQWSVTYGSSSYDIGRACAVDASGNVYFTGETTATSGIATPGSHQATIGSTSQPDAFLAKFDTNGNLLWGTYYGGINEDMGYGCDTDPSGNVYMAGTTRSTSGISTSGSHQPAIGSTTGGLKDGFLVKFNSSGVRQWATYYGSTGDDYAYACATDLYGNIFMSGAATSASGIATLGSYQPNKSGTMDAYVTKFTPAGIRLWGTYYGGTDFTYGYACATDGSGSVYMVGSIVVGTANMQAYIYKFHSSGAYQWGNLFGNSPGDERFQAVTADATGAVYVGGLTSTGLPVQSTAGSHQSAYGGGYDAIFIKLQDCNAVSTTPVSDLTVCNGNSTVISAASSTNTITWYATSTSTAVLGTGTTFTTPALSAGTYSYYASSDACLPNQRTAIVVTAQAGPAITAANGSICPGQSFTIVPSGATSYSYSSGSAVVSPVSTTVYTITGESAGGCNGTGTVQVTVNSLPVISAVSSTVCSGATATLTASGASTYTWNTGATGANLSVTPSSTTQYTVSGTASTGCVNTATASVVVTPAPVITVAGATVCAGTPVVLAASGVSSYTWNTGATSASVSVSPSSTTTYTVNGNDPGCPGIVSQTVTVTVNALPTIGISGTTTLCSGQSTVLSATGTANSYTWSTGQNTASLNVSPTTTTSYTVTGADANGCVNMANTMVTVNALPSVSASGSVICAGSTATLTAAGASTYTWNTGVTGASLVVSPASTTNYTVTGTSAAGCTNTATASVTVNPAPAITVNAATVCAGASATLTASGVNTYTWNTGANGSSLIVAPSSTTTYTVNGNEPSCPGIVSQTVTVTVNALPTIGISGTITLCSGQSTVLSATGTANSYTWSTGQTTASLNVSPTTTTSYTVIGADANGCVNMANTMVTVNALPSVSASGSAICAGSTATLTATGASTYTWNTGATGASLVVSPASTTNYTVTGTSAAGCTNTATASVTVNPAPAITVNTATVCAGASATLTASGVSTYTWNTGANGSSLIVAPSSTTTYTVNGNEPGCPGIVLQTVTVTVNALPTIGINGTTTLCSGQSTVLSATGTANSYTWSTGQNTASLTVSPTTNTSYTVSGSDANGCTNTANTMVTVNALPSVSASGSAICAGSTSTLTATGASTYTWNTGVTGASLVVSPASTTNYTVTGTSATGCTNTATASVTVNPAPAITVNTATVCAGASATLTASGVSTYTWNTGANGSSLIVAPSSTTTFTVSGHLAGCSTTAVGTTTVTVNALPVLNVSAVNNSICAGQSTTLSLTGTAASYTWSTGQTLTDIVVSPATSTVYSVTGTNANGCVNTGSISLTVNSNPVLSVPAASVCLGGTVTLTASGANTYTWNTGATGANVTISPVTTTQYTVTGTSVAGCIGNATVAVSVGPGPAVAVNHATICAGASALLTASGASSYTWSSGQQTPAVSVSPLSTSVYTVTGEMPGCNFYSVQTATVTVNLTPTVSITSSGTLVCVGQTPTLTAFGATTYTWSTTQVSNPVVVNPATTSSYTVTGASPQGCQGVAVITISVSPCTGLSENGEKVVSIDLYPNPFTGIFTIRYAEHHGVEVTVLNALGAIVYETSLSEERTEIALPYEAGGIYFVQIKTAQGVVTKKIVKE